MLVEIENAGKKWWRGLAKPGATVIGVGLLLSACASEPPSAKASATPGRAGNASLPASAPAWCRAWVAKPVQDMAEALPGLVGGGPAAGAQTTIVRAGLDSLRRASSTFPDHVQAVTGPAIDQLSVFADHPDDAAAFDDAAAGIEALGDEAHQECGL